MKNIFKAFLVFVIALSLFPQLSLAQTVTREEMLSYLQKRIAELQAKLLELQTQANTTQPKSTQCHEFKFSLGLGKNGDDIKYLQSFLQKEGLSIPDEELTASSFGQGTAKAVVKFQEKYKSDVLVPAGLAYGTGFVGELTRRKLTALYGCGKGTEPIISSLTSAAAAAPGVPVTIRGSNFTADANIVTFASSVSSGGPFDAEWQSTAIASKDGTTLVFVVPASLTQAQGELAGNKEKKVVNGKYYVIVTNKNGRSLPYTYTIVNSGLTEVNTDPVVNVVSPASGSAYKVGDTLEIKWTSSNLSLSAKVSLELFQIEKDSNGTIWRHGIALISSGTPNTGSFSWKIPATIQPGSSYAVKIQGCEATACSDYANFNLFSIN